ncbi:hypothetical protein Pcinc_019040 [Petrolisthes cinctipes]|uniref:Ig-like domain-containing protein n=1 Tax=Petrolisthes cinctipes TaxID=88211 RepID=A0AAE1FLZ4_PETCI|nr:hypothetical protein Pcinc_019040 [Petrolisthes cinctipes]
MRLLVLLTLVCVGEGQLRLPFLSSLLTSRLRSAFTPTVLTPRPSHHHQHRLDPPRPPFHLSVPPPKPQQQPPFTPSPQTPSGSALAFSLSPQPPPESQRPFSLSPQLPSVSNLPFSLSPQPPPESQRPFSLSPQLPSVSNLPFSLSPQPSPESQPPFSPSPQIIEAPPRLFHVTAESIQHPRIVFRDESRDAVSQEEQKEKEEEGNRQEKQLFSLDSEATTSTPFLISPTTIKFTLDDVPRFVDPRFIPLNLDGKLTDDAFTLLRQSPGGREGQREIVEGLTTAAAAAKSEEVRDNIFSSSTIQERPHLFILTSTEKGRASVSPSTTTTTTPTDGIFRTITQRGTSISGETPVVPAILLGKPDSNFKPSLSFPFLGRSTFRPQNSVTLIETKAPLVTSLLQADPLHHFEPNFNLFTLRPATGKDLDDNTPEDKSKDGVATLGPLGELHLSKTPTPKAIKLNEGDEEYSDSDEEGEIEKPTIPQQLLTENQNTQEPETEKPTTTQKTLNFNQDLLTLLKSHFTDNQGKTKSNKTDFPEGKPSWLRDQVGEYSTARPWRLKGGARYPTFFTPTTISPTKPTTTTQASATTTTTTTPIEVSAASLVKIATTPVKTGGISFRSARTTRITDRDPGGVFTTSFRALAASSTTSSLKTLTTTSTNTTTEGPQVVLVGEVGEVTHGGGRDKGGELKESSSVGSFNILRGLLSPASLKHGVQSLNVSAWVSGCPKLYGKAELNCEIHHDAPAKMTVTWKKKTFTEGRPEEVLVSEGEVLKVNDPRLSLGWTEGGHYTLAIKDFRPKDCGTYECEARAADSVAASQLLLFTCL